MKKRLVKLSLITSLAILLAMPTAGLAPQNANVAGKWLLTISTVSYTHLRAHET